MKYLLVFSFFLMGCITQTGTPSKQKDISPGFMKGVWKGVPDLDGGLEEWVFMDGGLYKRNQYSISNSEITYHFALDSLRWEMEGNFIYAFLVSGGDYQVDYQVEAFSEDSVKLTKAAVFKLSGGKYYRYIWTEGGIDTLNDFIRIDDKDTIEYSHKTVDGVYSETKGCNFSDDSTQCGQMWDTFGGNGSIYIKANQYQFSGHKLKRIDAEMKNSIK